ncbi:MAG: ABC transporter substrate-binding protein [Nitrospiraceae bacterium]|nr:MAG: ABC transporter substrate-binding protein [Nitrospiraceae bacterium]
MKMKLRIVFAAMFMIVMSMSSLSAGTPGSSALEAIRTTVEAVLDVMKNQELSPPGKKEERRQVISTLIRQRFDFEEMAKRSLAQHWQGRSPEEQKEFVSIFSDLLESSYVGKIEAYTDEKVTYDKEVLKGGGKYAFVSTTVITKEVDIPIEYKLISRSSTWLVYDVVIEGVSFISTYRSQYGSIIAKDSYSGLIQSMKKKLDEVNAL